MIRLADNLYSWNTFNEAKGINFNGFLIVCKDTAVIVDPPPHTTDDQLFLEKKLALKPSLAIVTNKDHTRNVQWWVDRYQIPLAMHENESIDSGVEVSMKLKDGEVVAGKCKILSLPGKTPGEIGILFEDDGGTLILGDALIGDPLGGLRFVPKEKIKDYDQLLKSVQSLRTINFERLLTGDGEPLLYRAKATVLKFLDGLS
ncbi:MAG: hypothetical protein COB53_02985 [Elusimicrobia bacterium]|nr:MAG: hypothetical protein COB53_02985 [Elusimicrobiota bacterium]